MVGVVFHGCPVPLGMLVHFLCVCAMSLYIEASNTELSVTSNSAEQQNAAAWHAG